MINKEISEQKNAATTKEKSNLKLLNEWIELRGLVMKVEYIWNKWMNMYNTG